MAVVACCCRYKEVPVRKERRCAFGKVSPLFLPNAIQDHTFEEHWKDEISYGLARLSAADRGRYFAEIHYYLK